MAESKTSTTTTAPSSARGSPTTRSTSTRRTALPSGSYEVTVRYGSRKFEHRAKATGYKAALRDAMKAMKGEWAKEE